MFYNKTKKDSKKSNKTETSKYLGDHKNPEILEVNLVKDELVVFFDWNKHIFSAILVLIVAGLFVFEIYLGLDYWELRETEKASAIEKDANKIKQDIIALNNSSKEALSYKDKSLAFGDLLNNHVYWTRFFSWLETNTINTVKYEGFDGDLSGEYVLSASAPSYAEAAWQAKILASHPMVKSAVIEEVSAEKTEVTAENTDIVEEFSQVFFDINLEVKTDIFKK